MSINEIRRKNLDRLIGEPGRRGRIANFAREHDLEPSYVSQILNKNRVMGERSARKFETVLKLRPGELDIPMGTDSAFDYLTTDQIKLLVAYRAVLPKLKPAVLQLLEVLSQLKS